MAKLYVINGDTSGKVSDELWKLQGGGKLDLITSRNLVSFLEIESAYASLYETDPALAAVIDEATRALILYGMAFEDQWCADEIWTVLVDEEGRAEVVWH